MKFEFFQRVMVSGIQPPSEYLNGLTGVVRGISISEDGSGSVSYGVSFKEFQDEVFVIKEVFLLDAGGTQTAHDFYTGESLKVPAPKQDD